MSLPNDPWIAENSQMPPERLHALGVITVSWNECETYLVMLFTAISRLRADVAWMLTREIGDLRVSVWIKEYLGLYDYPQAVREEVEFALKLHDENRINRNQLTHFCPSGFDFLRTKGLSIDAMEAIPNTTKDIRRVASEIDAAKQYFAELLFLLEEGGSGQPELIASSSWPKRPPLPGRLWKPPQPSQPKQPPPR